MLELSSGVEIVAYYHHLMKEVFLLSGRVTYLPLTKYAGNGEVVSTLSGEKQTVEHTTLVDGARLKSSIPSSHERKFGVADDVACIPPNRLPHLAGNHEHITVLGGGKTGCDSVTWLLSNGFPADRLRWVIPRDAWFWNRMSYQPGVAFFESTFASLAAQNEAMAAASSTEDLALGMERAGRWLRLDQHATPTMFHGGTISEAELQVLQSVGDVVRGRRVTQLDDDAMVLSDGERVVAEPDTLYVDCTASAAAGNVGDRTPIFEPGRINLGMIRQFQPCFSAALIAFIAAQISADEERHNLTRPTPMTDTVDDFVRGAAVGMLNEAMWAQNPLVGPWLLGCRLEGFAAVAFSTPPDDAEKMAVLGRLMESGPAALANLQKLAS